jgi:OFA family oxalate/formate antiporter-like MFS transporter
MILLFFNAALFSYGWSAFVNPIVSTFGWTMVQLSLASSLRGLESGIFNPLFGWIVDHYSAKKLMITGLLVNAAGIFMISQTKNLGMYYGGFLIMGLGSSLAISILPTTIIARWFKKGLGKANGIFFIGNGLGGIAAPLVVKIIDSIGWQTTLSYGAIGVLVIGIPAVLIYRDRPQDYNLLPDGAALVTSNGAKVIKASAEFGTSVKDALRMRAFWHLVGTVIFQNSFLGVLTMFTIPYLTSMGMTRTAAATVTSLFTFISLFIRVPFGMLSDKIRKSYCVALSVGFQTTGALFFWLLNGSSPFWMILIFAITYGIGLSGIMVLRPPILVEYFGTKNFGTIFALEGVFITIAGIASQPLAGWVFDTYHTYKPLWLGYFIFGLVALVVILTIPAAKRRLEPASEATPASPTKSS